MNPVPNTNPANGTSGCANVISSTCISWQGGDIECITICPGNTLTEVIQAISDLLCTSLDINGYNTTPISEEPFESFHDMIQAMIDEIASNTNLINNFECDCDEYSLPSILLPECILDNCPSCSNDPYPIDQALILIGDVFCQMIQENTTAITNLTGRFNDLKIENGTQLGELELDLRDQINTDIAVIEANTMVRIAAHQLTGIGNVGDLIPVNAAVEYLADRMYEHVSIVGGSSTNIRKSFEAEDPNLKNLPALNSATGDLMLQLPGWESNPNTMAKAVTNLWVSHQDLRAAYVNEHSVERIPCALVQPKNVAINSITTTNVNVSWEAHGQEEIQTEIEYHVNIYAYDGSKACGPSLASGIKERNQSNPLHTLNVTTSQLDPNKQYVVEVTALYPCGESLASSVVGQVVACTQTTKANAESRAAQTIPLNCSSNPVTPYNQLTREMRVVLTDNFANVINNNTGEPITIRLKYKVQTPLITNDVYEEYDFVIQPLQSASDWVEYTMYDQIFYQNSCQDIDRAENDQAVEILDPIDCFITAGSITFIP